MKLTTKQIKMLLIIVLIGMSGLMGIDIHLASLPYIMKAMQTTQNKVQLSIGLYILGLALSLLIYGPLSDKIGRRPVVIFGLSLAALSSFLAVFCVDINSFLILRFFQGAGAGVCAGLSRTMAADVLTGEQLVNVGSYFSLVVSLSPLFAPMVGAYLQHYFSWRANFIFLGGFLSMVMLAYTFCCEESNQHIKRDMPLFRSIIPIYFSLLRNKGFVAGTLVTGIATAASIAYATTSVFILQNQYHVSTITYGWLSTLVASGVIVGKVLKPTLTRRLGIKETILMGIIFIGLAGLGLGFLAITHFDTVALMMFMVFLTLIGQPFIMSNALYFALSPFHDKRGAAGGLFGSSNMLLTFTLSALLSLLPHDGIGLLAVCYILLAGLGFIIYFSLLKTHESHDNDHAKQPR